MAMSYKAQQDNVGLIRKIRRGINGLGRKCHCCICGKRFMRFSTYRGGWDAVSSYLKQLDWTGSDFDHFWCPFCRSHDRERHLKLYFDALNFWDKFKGATVLHIAPEKHIALCIESCQPKRYLKGDIVPAREGVEVMDVTAIPEADNTFDFVLCNHVLEHVPDDRKALSEIFRVLKPGGVAILQTPYAPELRYTRERDPSISTEAQRLEFYGQEDHIRLYGIDLLDRILESGFDLQLKKHSAVLPEVDSAVAGVNSAEPLFVARKH
ncbi:MAG: class I SAM-dependent methyltransferase [Kiritimatiellae bacterium]|nr:class I SAM-dependent methyltransferase [Kiritimatiellia bacterium]